MNKVLNQKLLLKLSIFLFILILPWFLFGIDSEVEAVKITSDLRFYEINTCSISLIDFLKENPNVMYQDHYKLRVNNYSSMRCFGTLTGVDQINHVFYISVGTNSFLNILLQTFFWCFLISLIRKTNNFKISLSFLSSIILSSLIFVFMFYAEERFYVKNLYFFDFNSVRYFLQLWLLILFICGVSFYFLNTRIRSLNNYLPFLYLVIGVFSGNNLNFFVMGITVFGFIRLFVHKKLWINKYLLLTLIFLWTNNAYNKEYFVDPDKIRGFTSTIFTSSSILLYSIMFVFLINGLIYIINNENNFNIGIYLTNFLYSSLAVIGLGYISSSNPLVNFINFYYLGGNKIGIERSNVFELNQWGERLSWRGQYASAETIGEFFAIGILIYLYLAMTKEIRIEKFQIFLLTFSFIGLFLSNNRAALLSIFICLLIFLIKKNRQSKLIKFIGPLSLFSLFLILIGSSNLSFTYDFLKESLTSDAIFYSLENNYSSSLDYVLSLENNSLVAKIISIISVFAFFVNRSELWGIFIARYNPEIQEFLFGTGFFNFGQLYGDVSINPTYSFLLPHSSILSLVLFLGLVNVVAIIIFLLKNFIFGGVKFDNIFPYLSVFVLLNLLKSDSILYFSAFANYLFIFLNTKKFGKSSTSLDRKVK